MGARERYRDTQRHIGWRMQRPGSVSKLTLVGILSGDEKLASKSIDRGCAFVAIGSDQSLLARSSEEIAARFGRKIATPATPDRVTSSIS